MAFCLPRFLPAAPLALLFLSTGCGTQSSYPSTAVLSDGKTLWQISISKGALQTTPYTGTLASRGLLLTDQSTGTTYNLAVTTGGTLTWMAATGPGVNDLPLRDAATGVQHELLIRNGTLTF